MRCEISPGFLLVCLWFAWGCGWQALGTVLLASAVHEAAHAAVLRAFGADISAFRVGAAGAVMEADTSRLSYGQELAAILAGPAANLASAFLLPRKAYALIGANLALCVFNLLPLPLLDGGRALRLGLVWRLGPGRGEWIAEWVGRLFTLCLGAVISCLMVGTGGSLWLLPTLGTLLRGIVKRDRKSEKFL